MNQPYPRLPEFNYHRPRTMREALDLLEKNPEQSRPYAGGTDCFVQIRDRRYLPEHLIDLKMIPELNEIHFDKKEGLKMGATVTMNQLIQHPDAARMYPILAQSAGEVAGYQLRTRATVAGNLCNASPCGDTIGPCMVYKGQVHLQSKAEERIVDVKDFFTGPGKTVRRADEIVTAVSFPVPMDGTCGVYKSIGRNKIGDLAIAAVTVLGFPNKECGSGYTFRIALTAVAPTVIFAVEAQDFLCEAKLSLDGIEKGAGMSATASKPITDIRGGSEYRRDMIQILTKRGLLETCEKLGISL